MINWRDGKAGFVGGLKYLIKGVFQYSHSVTTADVVPEIPEGITMVIDIEKRTMTPSAENKSMSIMVDNRTMTV